MCSGSVTEKHIQDHILHHRELAFRNRLLLRQAVSLEPQARSVFDGSYAANIFLSGGSKPFAEYIKKGGHPQTYAMEACRTRHPGIHSFCHVTMVLQRC